MEQVGRNPTGITGTIHDTETARAFSDSGGTTVPDACTTFHDYQMTWTPDRLVIGVKGRRFHVYPNPGTGPDASPFDEPQYLLLNLAIGGTRRPGRRPLLRRRDGDRLRARLSGALIHRGNGALWRTDSSLEYRVQHWPVYAHPLDQNAPPPRFRTAIAERPPRTSAAIVLTFRRSTPGTDRLSPSLTGPALKNTTGY